MPARRRALQLAFAVALASTLTACKGPQPRGAEAFAGAPLRTETREDTIEIQVLAEGQGPEAKAGDWVVVHYRLVLENGSEVDSSHRGKPLAFFLDRDGKLIEGFHRGVLGMKAGELRRAVVPPHLAYGERTIGPIPPNSTLNFEMELMRIGG